ncbi:hypothetical protein AQ490_00460 [Wenjunlia vitaminophila]|uniref:Secreted protein n=1 Tax=Wenjunlia vitaminophila TaxID=76728 RepID=A0A0T6LZ88_WENVI|nr:hypothetical protein [Wenjunlia vitaminophila]KRV51280.1 hypothetical protein AQ490_00460 [Wenjunlia vitaminophila]
MDETVVQIVLGVAASVVSAALGWCARRVVAGRRLQRTQRFFGLSRGAECLLVINQHAGAGAQHDYVARYDVFALLELSALIKECQANAELVGHDVAQPGFGGRTEFCIGGPVSNRRSAAHISSLLPGVTVDTSPEPGPLRGAFAIGGETYAMRPGEVEYVLLARVTVGSSARPVFLASGQRAITNQAAVRYLVRHHRSLARRHGANGTFCLLLKVINSEAYGPDVVELVADVTREARTPAT